MKIMDGRSLRGNDSTRTLIITLNGVSGNSFVYSLPNRAFGGPIAREATDPFVSYMKSDLSDSEPRHDCDEEI